MVYVALLRGINIGKRQVKMEILRDMMSEMGYKNISTVLASGNLIFEAKEKLEEELLRKIESKIQETFGFKVDVILRTMNQIKQIVSNDPFMDAEATEDLKLYITFLSKAQGLESKISIDTKYVKIIKADKNEIYWVVKLNPQEKTTDIMELLTRKYGKEITTRNWNTVQKIADMSKI